MGGRYQKSESPLCFETASQIRESPAMLTRPDSMARGHKRLTHSSPKYPYTKMASMLLPSHTHAGGSPFLRGSPSTPFSRGSSIEAEGTKRGEEARNILAVGAGWKLAAKLSVATSSAVRIPSIMAERRCPREEMRSLAGKPSCERTSRSGEGRPAVGKSRNRNCSKLDRQTGIQIIVSRASIGGLRPETYSIC